MINLLPPLEKEKIHSALLKKQVNSLGMLVITVLVGSSIFILNTMVFLKIQARELRQSLSSESLSAEAQEARSLEDTIKNLNALAAKYGRFKSDGVSATDIFSNIEALTPPGAGLTAMSVDALEKKIALSGQAETRDDVVALENRLKNSPFFERVESPLSNYLDKRDADFSFTFYITP